MAQVTRGTSFEDLFGEKAAQENDSRRRQIFDGQLARWREMGPSFGNELFTFISAIPALAQAADVAEYQRVVKKYGRESDRARALEPLILNGQALQLNVDRAKERVDRMMKVMNTREDVFHGFVSDESGRAQAGLTVQLTLQTQRAVAKAQTDDTGYFRIPLSRAGRGDSPAPAPVPAGTPGSSQVRGVKQEAVAAAPDKEKGNETAQESPVGHVEVLSAKGEVLYDDPLMLLLDEGTAYREYVVPDSGKKTRK